MYNHGRTLRQQTPLPKKELSKAGAFREYKDVISAANKPEEQYIIKTRTIHIKGGYMIRKRIDEILDGLPDEDLEEVYWAIQPIKKNYLFRNNLLEKGVLISEIYDEELEIIDKWDNTFARNICE